jgi:hypothetical protein
MCRHLGALVVVAALASPARGVVIASGSDAPNLIVPGNDPGWNNVGRVAGASGVYLGNRWVITANHVSQGALRLSDGRVFEASVGSSVRLSNSGTPTPFGSPDLRIFRLAEDPGLPALEVAETAPAPGQRVMMIGAGVDRKPELLGWQAFATDTGLEWSEVPLPAASFLGYSLLTSSQMRWGANFVATESSFGSDQTFSFTTRFDRPGLPFEAQAALGDSGGGVFHETDDGWQLVGIMTSTQSLGSQPANTAVFGDQTIIADLSVYGEQIMTALSRREPLWQNQVNYFDVSGDGVASPRDLLILANELKSKEPHELSGAPGESQFFLDTNGDYSVTTGDAQFLINHLLSGAAQSASSPAPGTNFVPEPTSVGLAVWGVLATAVAGALARRRRFKARTMR